MSDIKVLLEYLLQCCVSPIYVIVWISSVVRVSNPHEPVQISDSYGTVGKKKILDAGWDSVISTVFPNSSDSDDAIAPNFGLTQSVLTRLIKSDYCNWKQSDRNNYHVDVDFDDNGCDAMLQKSNSCDVFAIPDTGVKSLTLVLCAVHQVLGIEFCPLVPDIATILLTHMTESYAFATIRTILNDSSYFIPVSQKGHYSWCKTYKFFVRKMFPVRFKSMEKCGALSPDGLDPIFKRFFTLILSRRVSLAAAIINAFFARFLFSPIGTNLRFLNIVFLSPSMRLKDILRFMDIFLVEGYKAVFRLALSLVSLISIEELKVSSISTSSPSYRSFIAFTFS